MSSQVEYLISKKAEVNNKDKWMRTCLHMASNQGNTGIVRLLLAAKVSS